MYRVVLITSTTGTILAYLDINRQYLLQVARSGSHTYNTYVIDSLQNCNFLLNISPSRILGTTEADSVHDLDCKLNFCFSVHRYVHFSKGSSIKQEFFI